MSEEEKIEMERLQKKRDKKIAKQNKQKEAAAQKKRAERWAMENIRIEDFLFAYLKENKS
mgnify:CR=1 FL=1